MDTEALQQLEWLSGWKINRLIGEGGFGKVYEIERDNYQLKTVSALKVITIPHSSGDLEDLIAEGYSEEKAREYFYGYVKAFADECAILSKLRGNSNIVSFEDYKIIEHDNEIGWDILIRMELLTPLNEYIRDHVLPREEIIKLGISLCNALEVCKKQNIIHRDIKLANIFISPNGDYKLGDFGVARIIGKSGGASTKIGTMDYIAPEVFRGEKYDGRADIYSLGLVLYRMFNDNRLPFLPPAPNPITYEDKETANEKRLSGVPIPKPANADKNMYEILLKATDARPQRRYASPSEFRTDLERDLQNRNRTHKKTIIKIIAGIGIGIGAVAMLIFIIVLALVISFSNNHKTGNTNTSVTISEQTSVPDSEITSEKTDFAKENGLICRIVLGSGGYAIPEYDSECRMISKSMYLSNGDQGTVEKYSYDSSGNMTTKEVFITDGVLQTKSTYEYDSSGRPVSETIYGASGEAECYISHEYPSDDVEIVYTDNEKEYISDERKELHYEYDSSGNVTKISEYDENGNLSAVSEYKYNSDNKIESYIKHNSVGAVLEEEHYEY